MNAVIKNEIAKIALDMLNSHNERKKDCISMFDKIKSVEDFKQADSILNGLILEEVALEVLPIEHRAIISMRLIDKMKYRDIAISLRCNNKKLDYKGKALFIDSLVEYYMKYDGLVLNKEL